MPVDVDSQYIVQKNGIGEYEEKKSKFLAGTYYISSEKEALDIIETVRKKYYDARHNCYAYKLGENNARLKLSDDGEPSQTAGRPIMDVIEGHNITNILLTVTRYFGGIKLGTGGLARAYSEAAKRAIDDSELSKVMTGRRFEMSVDYQYGATIENFFRKNEVFIEETLYSEKETFRVMFPAEKTDEIIKELMNILGTSDIPDVSEPVFYVIQNGILKTGI